MKKFLLIVAGLTWICVLILLIIALTNNNPDNNLIKYRFVIGLVFICITGLIGGIFKKVS